MSQALLAISTGNRENLYKPLTPANSSPEPIGRDSAIRLAKTQSASLIAAGSSVKQSATSETVLDLGICSYAKLVGPGIEYYVQTTSFLLGSQSAAAFISAESSQMRFILPNAEGVLPLHAHIFYSPNSACWALECISSGTAVVDGHLCTPFNRVPLHSGSWILIGSNKFCFLLPNYGYIPGIPENSAFPSVQPNERLNQAMYSLPLSSHTNTESIYERPGKSYAALIAEAILSSPSKKMTLNEIYEFLTGKYPYFQVTTTGWQNSVRHNLSLNKCFVKVPRTSNEPGKGMFWMIQEPSLKVSNNSPRISSSYF